MHPPTATNSNIPPAPNVNATPQQLMAWLATAIGPDINRFGGYWTDRIREDREAVVTACAELEERERLAAGRNQRPIQNRGGWLKDVFFKIRDRKSRANPQNA